MTHGVRRIKLGKWAVIVGSESVGQVVEYLGKFCAAGKGDRFIINKTLDRWPTYDTLDEAAEHCVNFAKGFARNA